MSRLSQAIIRRIASGWVGRIAREGAGAHALVYGPPGRVTIDPTAVVNDALINTVSGTVSVGAHSFFGHGVALLTGTHDTTLTGARRKHAIPQSGRDIVIGDGVWLAGNVTVIGPCRIGDDAVVYAGAVVTRDVSAGAVVAGVPARPLATASEAPDLIASSGG